MERDIPSCGGSTRDTRLFRTISLFPYLLNIGKEFLHQVHIVNDLIETDLESKEVLAVFRSRNSRVESRFCS